MKDAYTDLYAVVSPLPGLQMRAISQILEYAFRLDWIRVALSMELVSAMHNLDGPPGPNTIDDI